MTTVSQFFKHDADQAMGVFYPTDYLVAFFASHDIALQAKQQLEQNDYKSEDILVLRGEEFAALADQLHDDASTWSRITAAVSKVVGTEELHLDNDIKAARQGAGFLAVHCPTEEEGQKIFTLLKPLGPVAMRRYSPYTIDRMV